MNVVVRGSGVYRIDGEEVPVRAGTFLRFDPETTRCPVAGAEGMTLLAVGARAGATKRAVRSDDTIGDFPSQGGIRATQVHGVPPRR